jgi:hypothetical protein
MFSAVIPSDKRYVPGHLDVPLDSESSDEFSRQTRPKALTLYADTGGGFSPYTDLIALGGRSAAAVDACSFGNGGKAHDSLLVALAVYACMLMELRVFAAQEAGPHTIA